MPKIVESYLLKLNGSYKVIVIEDGERLWVRLSGVGTSRLSQFWSTKLDEPEVVSYKAVITELESRLTLVEEGEISEIDVFEFWPRGWDYWGGGIPMPIASYIDSEEFIAAASN